MGQARSYRAGDGAISQRKEPYGERWNYKAGERATG